MFRGTTIVCVKKNGHVAMAGDGQVTLNNTVIKHRARKVRRIYNDTILVGFAGATADALTLTEKLEQKLERYNGFPSINIWGEAAPGKSSGEAMQVMEEAVTRLPRGVGFDWTGLSYQERMAGAQAPLLYAFSILVIFLCLAALY